jgi:DNA-binding NarL/FixJ family response regulator
MNAMSMIFAETLRKLRTERGLSQKDLADQVYITRSTVAHWENGSRLPDASMLARLSHCLGVDVSLLLNAAAQTADPPCAIMVDDNKIVLSGGLPVLEKALPWTAVTGFTRPSAAVDFAKNHRVALAFLDIEMGKTNGLDICKNFLEINPQTNVIFLTAYVEYSFEAWSTGASGYLLKPITAENLRAQLKRLRYPLINSGEIL